MRQASTVLAVFYVVIWMHPSYKSLITVEALCMSVFLFKDAVQEPLSVTFSLLAKLIVLFLCFMCIVPNTEKVLNKYLLKTEQTSAQGQTCIQNLICMYLFKQRNEPLNEKGKKVLCQTFFMSKVLVEEENERPDKRN